LAREARGLVDHLVGELLSLEECGRLVHKITYRYTTGTASGSVPFTIPSNLAPGAYQLRLFANNGYTLLATSSNFTVSAPNITLSASPASVLPGGIETAAWDGIPGPSSSNWVGLYTPAAADTAYISWRYTTGTASGSVPFTLPAAVTPGTYQLRIFSSGYTRLATSGNFTVGLSLAGAVSANGLPLANVAFAATNGAVCGSSTASGQYTCSVPPGWSGSITPQLSGYVFTPSSRSYSNVTVAQTAQNYTAIHNFQVIGTVRFNGAPLANVAFTATNGVNCTSSNASGQYSCIAPQWWSGTVTPALSGYTFTPATHNYSNITANQSAQDYAAAANTAYFVSGTVSTNALPLANVTLAAANGGVCSPSNALGQYSCAVAPGWSGTVMPSASGYSFTPASRSLTSVGTDQTAQDFAATLTSASAPMFFVHVDHLNTPRLISDQSGQAVWRWDQDEPFGASVANEDPSGFGAFEQPLRFPGQYFDKETGLAHNYFRDYQSSFGRYVESDPIGLAGGINTFAYTSGNALRYVDPSGQYGVLVVCVAAFGIGVAGGYFGLEPVIAAIDFSNKAKAAGNMSSSRSEQAVQCAASGDTGACKAAEAAEKQLPSAAGAAVGAGADLAKEIAEQRISGASKTTSYPSSAAPAGNAPRYPNFPSNNGPSAGPYGSGYNRTQPAK
jgi:RHS repeat-associated protein